MKLLAHFLTVLGLTAPLFAFSGHITTNTTWDADIILTGDIWVDPDVTLTIMPGVTVWIPRVDQDGDGRGDIDIIVEGRMISQGQVDAKVRFTSMEENPQPGDWLGVDYTTAESGDLSTITHTEFLYAYESFHINGRNVTFNNCRFAESEAYGVRIQSTMFTTSLNSCVIEECGTYGLLIEEGIVTTHNSTIFNNGTYGLRVESAATLTANTLTSSTNAEHGIEIYSSNVHLSDARSVSNRFSGIYLEGCSPLIENCSLSNNGDYGVMMYSNVSAEIANCDILANNNGLLVRSSDSAPIITYCNIMNNTASGVYVVYNAQPVINYCNIYDNRSISNTMDWILNGSVWSGWSMPPLPLVEGITQVYSDNDHWSNTYGCFIEDYTNMNVFSHSINTFAWRDAVTAKVNFVRTRTDGATHRIQQISVRDNVEAQFATSNTSYVLDANYNYWGQILNVDQLVYQRYADHVQYETFLTSEVVGAGAMLSNLPPQIEVTCLPELLVNPESLTITWSDRDVDSNALIDIYYDDDLGQDGVLIASSISEDDETDSIVWNFDGVPYGDYYIYAIIDDGINPSVLAYSTDKVVVGPVSARAPLNAAGVAGTSTRFPILAVNTLPDFGIYSFQFTLSYDPAILTATAVSTDSTLSAEWTVFANTNIDGQISVNGFSTVPLDGAGNLVFIEVDVSALASNLDSCPLSFAEFDFNEVYEGLVVQDGLFTVVNQYDIGGAVSYYMNDTAMPNVEMLMSGDNSSSEFTSETGEYLFSNVYSGNYLVCPNYTDAIPEMVITPFDASLVAQFSLALIALTGNQQTAADVTGDGSVTVFDAARIAQYSVGIIDTFEAGDWTFTPDCIEYNLTQNTTTEVYYGIAIGDPSGNWTPAGPRSQPSNWDFAAPGLAGRFELPLTFDDAFQSYLLDYSYNAEYVQLVEVQHAGALDSFEQFINDSDGRIRLAGFAVEAVQLADPALTMVFEARRELGSEPVVFRNQLIFDESPVSGGEVSVGADEAVPASLTLYQNFPNPFNPTTTIQFDLPEAGAVSLEVFNLKGELVETLLNEELSSGSHKLIFDAAGYSSGVYFYRLNAEQSVLSRKMVILK